MRFQTYTWGGVAATVYYLNRGEKVDRHQHPIEHTTVPLVGQSLVDIDDGRALTIMKPGDPNLTLPANVDHEIMAVDDGTVVMNMVVGSVSGDMVVAKDGEDGGVELDAA